MIQQLIERLPDNNMLSWLILALIITAPWTLISTIKETLKDKELKGSFLEVKIAFKLINTKGYHVESNIFLKKENGDYTEIDIVYIHKVGIFIIEAKNYSGWIFGNENDAKWTQSFSNGKKIQFFNPIKQNNIHVNAMKKTLENHSNVPIYSIIVFGNDCELKDITVYSENIWVIQIDDLVNTINTISDSSIVNVSQEDRDSINEILKLATKDRKSKKKKHIENIEANKNKCPFCKSDLTQRINEKTGNLFYGCEKFPKCRYTTNEIKN